MEMAVTDSICALKKFFSKDKVVLVSLFLVVIISGVLFIRWFIRPDQKVNYYSLAQARTNVTTKNIDNFNRGVIDSMSANTTYASKLAMWDVLLAACVVLIALFGLGYILFKSETKNIQSETQQVRTDLSEIRTFLFTGIVPQQKPTTDNREKSSNASDNGEKSFICCLKQQTTESVGSNAFAETNDFFIYRMSTRFNRLPCSDSHPVLIHPLIQKSKYVASLRQEQSYKPVKEEGTVEGFLDPLGAASPLSANINPISSLEAVKKSKNSNNPLDNTLLTNSQSEGQVEELWDDEQLLIGFRPWKELKQRILNQFKTDVRLTLQNTFLSFSEDTSEKKLTDSSKYNQKQLLLSSINKRFWLDRRDLDFGMF